MCGRFFGSWVGAVSVPPAGHWSGTRRPFINGRNAVGRTLKKAREQGRTIVFIDESGLSQQPNRCRTWAPKGETPVLQYHFNWKKLSAIAGVTRWNFYFQLYPGSIRSPQVIE